MSIDHDEARRILDGFTMLRHPCDLDLLIFFARHPRTLMASEQLASFLGYEIKQIADSLDVLIAAGFLKRSQNPSRAARMYLFMDGASDGGGMPDLLRLGANRQGRLALIRLLTDLSAGRPTGLAARAGRDVVPAAAPRPVLVTSKPVPRPLQSGDCGPRTTAERRPAERA